MSDTKTETASTEAIIRRAIADPDVPRGDNYAEPLTSWQARAVLAALEANGLTVTGLAAAKSLARIAAVRELHYEFKIYESCGHTEHDDEADVIVLDELGAVCRKGYMYSVCHACCAPGDEQTEACVDGHDHTECWKCATRKAVDEPVEEVAARG